MYEEAFFALLRASTRVTLPTTSRSPAAAP